MIYNQNIDLRALEYLNSHRDAIIQGDNSFVELCENNLTIGLFGRGIQYMGFQDVVLMALNYNPSDGTIVTSDVQWDGISNTEYFLTIDGDDSVVLSVFAMDALNQILLEHEIGTDRDTDPENPEPQALLEKMYQVSVLCGQEEQFLNILSELNGIGFPEELTNPYLNPSIEQIDITPTALPEGAFNDANSLSNVNPTVMIIPTRVDIERFMKDEITYQELLSIYNDSEVQIGETTRTPNSLYTDGELESTGGRVRIEQ